MNYVCEIGIELEELCIKEKQTQNWNCITTHPAITAHLMQATASFPLLYLSPPPTAVPGRLQFISVQISAVRAAISFH